MSKITPKFRGKIQGMEFVPENPVRYKQRLTELEGKEVNVSMVRHREQRSNNQNRYYWGVVISMITLHCGYTDNDCDSVHEEMKKMFLGTQGRLQIAKSSAENNTKEFEEYLSKIRTWAGTGGAGQPLYIPLPNEVDY